MNVADYVIIVRIRDLKKIHAQINKNCYNQTWAAGRLASNSVWNNLKVNDDARMNRSCDLGKIL